MHTTAQPTAPASRIARRGAFRTVQERSAGSVRRRLSPVGRRRLSNAGLALCVALIALFCLAPFYWMFVSSLKGPNDIFNNDLWPASQIGRAHV